MKNLILTALLILPMIVSGNEINTLDAAFHKGKEVVACGTLKQVSEFKKGLYLNMDNKYPKQSVTFVIWKDKVEEFNTKFGDILNADETTVNVVKSDKVNSYMWVYCSGADSPKPDSPIPNIVLYDYHTS